MSEGRAPSTAQGERSRAALLDAAARLFSERGYAATGVHAVCREAGVAKTALYWHFGSKEALLAAVVEHVGGAWIERIQKRSYQTGDPAERLNRLIDEWRHLVLEETALLRLLLIAQLERANQSDATREALARLWQRAERALVEGIEDSIGRTLPDLDQVGYTMLTLLNGLVLRGALDLDPHELERRFDEFRRVVVLLLGDRLRLAGAV